MKMRLVCAVLCCLVGASAFARAPGTFLIRNVNVVPMTSASVLRDQVVVTAEGLIAAVGSASSVAVPAEATVIDAQGGYLLPGLTEMHAHVPGVFDQQYLEDILFLYVANGITTARGMLGQPTHLKLRQQLAEHDILGPRLITSGPSLNGRSVISPGQAADMVRQQAAAGYDFIKLHPGLERAEFDAAMAAGAAAGIPLAGHVSTAVGLSAALAAGQATVDHLDGYMAYLMGDELADDSPGFFGANWVGRAERDRVAAAARATYRAGVAVVPTQSLIEHVLLPLPGLAERAEMRYMPPRTVAQWREAKESVMSAPEYSSEAAAAFVDLRRALLKALHDAGVPILLGSDAPQIFNVPGFSIHDELASYRAAGLAPYDVLATGTVQPARFFAAEDRFGTIQAGLAADLIVVRDNPLEQLDTLRQPVGVMVRGVWLSRAQLDRRLAEIAARHTP